jgi:flagellar biosynthesis protein FlhA
MATAVAGKPPVKLAAELAVPLGIISIVLMMVLPVPPLMLDGLLAVSLTISIGVFLIALFIEKPLDYSVFPAVVLVATLLRLSLNVATTRQILLHGTEGHSAAGRVVEAFGQIVVGGNVVVGLVVFFILVIINFVVITKGAGRVAEVAARFTLDAMPGKQMAIDAELNAGLITADVAKQRRRDIEREADFFGAMDGASKFVHGDAVAGLLIAVINLVGGLLIGLSAGMGLAQAAETFSILTIGDALVTQMPSLLVSTASGVVVTRSATGEPLGRALGTQLLGSPRAVGLTAGVLGSFALVPGMPALPFLTLAGVLGFAAWNKSKLLAKVEQVAAAPAAPAPGSAEDLESSMTVDLLALEVGYELIAAVDPSMGGTLLDRISVLRRQFALDLGFIMPPVRVRDNLQLEPGRYRFCILGTEVAGASLRAGHVLAMKSSPDAPDLMGESTVDPAFGTRAWWVPLRDREQAEALGYTLVDSTTVLVTHLGEIVRAHAHQLLGRGEMQQLLDVFSRSHPKMVDDLIPNMLAAGDVLKVLRNLMREGVSIRDLRSIVEALIEFSPSTKDTEQLTELTRQRLSRQVTAAFKAKDGVVHALVLHPQVEDMFQRSLRDIAAGTGGALDPEETRRLGICLERGVARLLGTGRNAVLVTRPDLRRYVRAFAERRVPSLAVLSFREIDANVTIRPFETIGTQI